MHYFYQDRLGTNIGKTQKERPFSLRNQHAVCVAMLWQKFKEDTAAGHPSATMAPAALSHVVERRRLAARTAATAPPRAKAAATKRAQKDAEVVASCVSRMSAVTV
jgi:hypothetical protein